MQPSTSQPIAVVPAVEVLRPSQEQLLAVIRTSTVAIVCEFCARKFKNRGALRLHMEMRHNSQIGGGEEQKKLDAMLGTKGMGRALKFCCPIAGCAPKGRKGRHYESAKLLVQHFQKAHCEKSNKCPECPARFALERDLRYHRKKLCPAKRDVGVGQADRNTQQSSGASSSKQRQCAAPVANKTILLLPFGKQLLFKRILPNRSTNRKSVSTQTEQFEDAAVAPQQASCYYECAECYGVPPPGGRSNVQQEVAQNTFSGSYQLQNACVQTIYPQTIDFSAQYPTAGASSAAGPPSSLYLPPLLVASSTQTQVNFASPAAFQTSNLTDFPKQRQSTAEDFTFARRQHCETQTSHQLMTVDGLDGVAVTEGEQQYCWMPGNGFGSVERVASVAAQTDLRWDGVDEWFREGS